MTDNEVTIKYQKPKAVRYEVSFPNLKPKGRQEIKAQLDAQPLTFKAHCASIVVNGTVSCKDKNYVAELEVIVDGKKKEKVLMPALYRLRRLDVYWDYDLKPGEHTFSIQWLNPREDATVKVPDAVLYERRK